MMKLVYLLLIILFLYGINLYLNNEFIATESKIFEFIAKDYPSEVANKYIENQKKYWWFSYVFMPLLICIKVLLVAFCLNFIKLFDLPGLEKVEYKDFVFIVLLAEFIFIIAGLYKFVNFYWLQTDYTLEDLQTYYPISLINLRDYISEEKWLAYPLQLVNLFELFYWGFLAWGITELSDNKVKFGKSFGLVALTYGAGLLFWVGVVSFLILNAQY